MTTRDRAKFVAEGWTILRMNQDGKTICRLTGKGGWAVVLRHATEQDYLRLLEQPKTMGHSGRS